MGGRGSPPPITTGRMPSERAAHRRDQRLGRGLGGHVGIGELRHHVEIGRLHRGGLPVTMRKRPEQGARLGRLAREAFEIGTPSIVVVAGGEPFLGRQILSLLRDRLVDGGRAALQVITIAEEGFEEYRSSPDFIQRYIFPGGMLPTRRHLHELATAHGLSVDREEAFGLDYARTLAEWRARFLARWPEIGPLGFDERFRRMWEYYLAYCEGGFRGGHIDVHQIAYTRS